MSMLRDNTWKLKYTPDDGDLVQLFYVPALESAVHYDRLTGYFNANALALAARGIESLTANQGRMRLIVGCTLEADEIAAIEQGALLREQVEKHLAQLPLQPRDEYAKRALELLTWMVAHRFLDVRVAVPCDVQGRPVTSDGIFHEKAGIIQDTAGELLAWSGSLNETAAGWKHNWESINVYTSWGPEPGRVYHEKDNFESIWTGRARRVVVLDMPEAIRRDLMRFMPTHDTPARLRVRSSETPDTSTLDQAQKELWKNSVWSFIRRAPARPDGESVGEATAPIRPWPHQIRAFNRMYDKWPPRLLIADEVGLGKTIQAGMLLRQAWLARRARRILILAPKALLKQWQLELREKFNLDWPIYDGRRLIWYSSPHHASPRERLVAWDAWHAEPIVLTSSQMMRRKDRAKELCERADRWDLVILDEAHHARRRGAGSWKEGGPNNLLSMMQRLAKHCDGLLLLTATPMQVAPVEVWDLLMLLGLPAEWTESAFLAFFERAVKPTPSVEDLLGMAEMFRSVERQYGEVPHQDAESLVARLSKLETRAVLRALRHPSSYTIPLRRLNRAQRQAAVTIMRASTPIRKLISRHTRNLLREYFKRGLLSSPIAVRKVDDRFIAMMPQEQALYDALDVYIRDLYRQAEVKDRAAVGLVMVTYRRRLASSTWALRRTLERRLRALQQGHLDGWGSSDEDMSDDELADEFLDSEETEHLERQALGLEQGTAIQGLLTRIERLPPDSKIGALKQEIAALRARGYRQVMVFTQYTDTIDSLRKELGAATDLRLMCFSGRGGEVPAYGGGSWSQITRDDAKRRFRNREADVLLCSDAAAEGLNFQFCGALINFDMPWNPMKVEQRIGRIDRLGQEHEEIRIINLHYQGTVETDVYRALRARIRVFEDVVGGLQPILAQLPTKIRQAVLGEGDDASPAQSIYEAVVRHGEESLDLDVVTERDLSMPARVPSPITMEDLDRVIREPALMPADTSVEPMGQREYKMSVSRADNTVDRIRVTTDPAYFERHSDSVELWSPGSPCFEAPSFDEPRKIDGASLSDILDRRREVG